MRARPQMNYKMQKNSSFFEKVNIYSHIYIEGRGMIHDARHNFLLLKIDS